MRKVLNGQFFMLGVGILITWSSFIATLDWLNLQFPGRKVNFIFPLVWFLPNIIFQSLTIWKGNLISFNLRINSSFIVGIGFFLLAFVCATRIKGDLGFYLLLLSILIFASFNSVAEASLYGLTSILSHDYTNSYIIGIGTSGLIIASLRLLCLACFSQDSSDLLESTAIYYTLSSLLLFLCIFIQNSIMRHPEVIQKLLKTHKQALNPELDLELEKETSAINDTYYTSCSFKDILSKIWLDLVLMGVNLSLTMALFPGVALATSDENIPYSWLNTIMVMTFNSGDILGRLIPIVYIMNEKLLAGMTFMRFVFCYTLIGVAIEQSPTWLFGSLWFKLLNVFLFSSTSGYNSTCYIIKMTSTLPESMREKCGYIVSASMLIFFSLGSAIALFFTNIGHIPSS